MAQAKQKTAEYRLVKVMGRQAWYVRFTSPDTGKSIVKSTGKTNKAAAEKWLEEFKKNQGGEPGAARDDKFQALVEAWEAADSDARGRFVVKLLTPIIGGK